MKSRKMMHVAPQQKPNFDQSNSKIYTRLFFVNNFALGFEVNFEIIQTQVTDV